MSNIDVVGSGKLNVSDISIDDVASKTNIVRYLVNPSYNYKEDTLLFATETNPLSYGEFPFFGNGNFLGINSAYYDANKEQLDDVISSSISKLDNASLKIESYLFTEKVANAIKNNDKIKNVWFEKEYVLSKDVYDLLKDANLESIQVSGMDSDLDEVFDPVISCNLGRHLINYYDYESLINKDTVLINEPLNERQFKYLKYIKNGAEIILSGNNDFNNLFAIINELEKKDCKIKIELTGFNKKFEDYNYKNEFVNYIFSNPGLLELNNIEIEMGLDNYSFVEFVKNEKRLFDLVRPCLGMSPFEKYLYVYNVVKKFKEYKENNDDLHASRNIYQILDNDYMVCVGFAHLLKDLLEKVGINSADVGVEVETTMDKVEKDITVIPDDVQVSSESHARLLVNLVDPKYNIDGYYYTDPTWDNEMDKDTYNFSLMTQKEYDLNYRANYFSLTNFKDLLSVNNLEDFYLRINIYLDRKERDEKEHSRELYDEKIEKFKKSFVEFMDCLKSVDPQNYEWYSQIYGNIYNMKNMGTNVNRFMTRIKNVVKSNKSKELSDKYYSMDSAYDSVNYFNQNKYIDEVRNRLMSDLIDYFLYLDPTKYKELKQKYYQLSDRNFSPDDKLLSEFLYDVGEYFVRKINNAVSGEKIMAGVRTLYEEVYKSENVDEVMDKIITDNKERQVKCFPVRYKVLVDGTKIPIENEENKFDFEVKKSL